MIKCLSNIEVEELLKNENIIMKEYIKKIKIKVRNIPNLKKKLLKYNLTEFEVASFINLVPSDEKELINLIPSINQKINNEDIITITKMLSNYVVND